MKKLGLIAMALALVVGLTQCKKETDSDTEANGVFITLNVSNGSRVAVDPTHGGANDYATVTWEDGDVLYVGNNGAYCGYLTYGSSKFSGTITPTAADDADYLHFYFMGNKGTTSEPTSVSITDQTSKYPVIMYGHSEELYSSGTTSYTATLKNKCAIVKFTTTNIDADITILGMNNTVTVDFTANNGATTGEPYSFGKSGDGEITLHAESNTERWAILLPQAAVTTATATATGYATETAFTVPAITANMYHNSGISVELSATPYIDAAYTVASGTTVRFARGNLIAVSDGEYGFDANQYDVHTDVATLGTGYPRYYFTWNEVANGNDDPKAFSIGDNTYKALTSDQWKYLVGLSETHRTTTSGHFYVKATVNGQFGVILLPDNWSDSYFEFTGYNTTGTVSNTVTSDQWTTLEGHGCVFLPVAGYTTDGAEVKGTAYGYYWAVTEWSTDKAHAFSFRSNKLLMNTLLDKNTGYPIRLVKFD